MKIISRHNPELFRKEHEERWSRLWEKKITGQKIYLAAAVFFLIIAIQLMGSGNFAGYLFLSLALFGIYTTVNYLVFVRKQKKAYWNKLNKMSEAYKYSNSEFSWEFSDDQVHYEDFQMSQTFKWQALSYYYIEKDSLYLVHAITNDPVISIGRNEVTEEQWNDVINFIQGKLKAKDNAQVK